MEGSKEATKELDKIVEYALLYDFYGALLKENQSRIFEDYMLNDLSLGEISELWGISRQGVYDVVKRSIKKLEEYESRLRLIEKFNQTSNKVKEVQTMIQEMKRTGNMEYLERIEEYISDITDV